MSAVAWVATLCLTGVLAPNTDEHLISDVFEVPRDSSPQSTAAQERKEEEEEEEEEEAQSTHEKLKGERIERNTVFIAKPQESRGCKGPD